ncbi:MAG: NAD(P)H-dependent oxidoreductase [Chitinophagaceae bacterium]|nr:NAD(P)H-dependent oxidoreductase [Chitinophagaceae bacterium]
MRILIISGSARANSVTRRVATYLQNYLEEKTHYDIDLIDLRKNNLPPVESVYTSLESTPDRYKSLAENIFNANAFILVSPEYNGSYSPAMKNLLDHFPKHNHKAFGIVTASPGAMGGMRAAMQLQQLIFGLFGIGSPHMLIIPAVDKKFDADGKLVDESFEKNIHNFVTEFIWLAEKLTGEKRGNLKKAV